MNNLIIKMAFVVSVPMYIVVAYLASGKPDANTPDVTLLSRLLAAVYAGQILIAPMLVRSLAMKQPDPNLPQARLQRFIIQAAFYESGAIYGLVLAFLSHTPIFAVYFGVPAMLCLLLASV